MAKQKKEKETNTQKTNTVKNTVSNVKNRLTDAYANSKPEVKTFSGDNGKGASLSVGGERVGGVSSRIGEDGKRYSGVYADNMGSVDRGVRDTDIKTPLGTVSYGYDGDTSYAGYTSPIRREDITATDGTRMSGYNYDANGDGYMNAWARKVSTPNEPNSYVLGHTTNSDYDGYVDHEINTPLGTLGYGREGDAVYGQYTSPITRGGEALPNGGYDNYVQYGNNTLGSYVDPAEATNGIYYDRNGKNVGQLYSFDWTDENGMGNTAYGGAINTPFGRGSDYYGELNLPTGGMIGYSNQNGRLSADYTPAPNSLQARLLNAMVRRR